MPLTLKSNGSGASNLIQASWWNDLTNLFTGGMQDQIITFQTNVNHKAISAPPTAPSVTTAPGTNLGIGVYQYAVSFVGSDGGETLTSSLATLTTTSGNAAGSLSSIPTGPIGTSKRRLYRTKVGASQLFKLADISDNTTTTYMDSATDASLPSTTPPAHPTFGGSINFTDASGNVLLTIANDGAVVGDLAVTGTITFGGKLTVSGVAVLDMTGFDGYVGARGGSNIFHIQANGSDIARFSSSAFWMAGTSIQTNGNFIGFKKGDGTRLAEMTSGGNMIVSGGYFVSISSYNTGTNAVFDGFDFSEIFQVDQEYLPGTVVCPADVMTMVAHDGSPQLGLPRLTRCSHDRCNLAMIVVSVPGFCSGVPNLPSKKDEYDPSQPIKQACAMVGRVFVRTAWDISPRSYVCSDGRGGVRPVKKGESALVLGVTLSPTSNGMVPLLIRPVFIGVL